MASILMFISSGVFTVMGEPSFQKEPVSPNQAFFQYLHEGWSVFQTPNKRFRLFVYAQWCGGAVLMAMPFYVVQANVVGFDLERVALLLAAQTAGALASNVVWGWWGDRLGKVSLLRAIACGRIIPPAAVIFCLLQRRSLPGETDALYVWSSCSSSWARWQTVSPLR